MTVMKGITRMTVLVEVAHAISSNARIFLNYVNN